MGSYINRLRKILTAWPAGNDKYEVYKTTTRGNKKVYTGTRDEVRKYAADHGMEVVFRSSNTQSI